MKYYVIRTRNKQETKVAERLEKEVEHLGIKKNIGEILLPKRKTLKIKNGKRYEKELLLFPGYIFIQTDNVGEVNDALKTINGSLGFLRNNAGEIIPMRESEVKNMKKKEKTEKEKDFSDMYSVNEMVTITEGAFSNFKGKILNIDSKKNTVILSVNIFGRPTEVTLSIGEIKKLHE